MVPRPVVELSAGRRAPVAIAHLSLVRSLSGFALALAVAGRVGAAAEIPASAPGPYAVGSSNLEVIDRRAEPMIDYLKGMSGPPAPVYLADILAQPESALILDVNVPADRAAYRGLAGTSLPLALYALYPTTPENGRDDYTFPYPETADNVFPHMQRTGEKPVLAGDRARWPLVVFSHGYEGHGLWDLDHLKYLAAHGYIVVSVFHGDGRAGLQTNLALRPLQLRATLDFLLSHPDLGPAIDPDRIGLSGSSFGAGAILGLMGGATPPAPPAADPRVKAGFGLVPFTGARFGFWPFNLDAWPFGRDLAGLRSVRLPYLAVYGGNDDNVTPESVLASVAQVSGPVLAVELEGEAHLLSKAGFADALAWELLFFDTWLRGDAEVRKLLESGSSVRGGVVDRATYRRAPRAPGR